MKSEKEIVDQITMYNKEIDELISFREHAAANKWWSIVAECKKVEGIRNRDKRQLEAVLNS
jgi:hypothetical protein